MKPSHKEGTFRRIIITDLDGTLLNDKREVHENDYLLLKELGRDNHIRVVATGRSLYSVKRVLNEHFPIDYLLFSCGAGIVDWKTKELLKKSNLSYHQASQAVQILKDYKVDFMLHMPVPENHVFFYWQTNKDNADFIKRRNFYKAYAHPLKTIRQQEYCQIVAILPVNRVLELDTIREEISFARTIRATSPLNHKDIWLEIFPFEVSKSLSSEWLCQYLGIEQKQTIAVGNDFNDLDLLDWAEKSFLVANAPEKLKKPYSVVSSNNNNGFSEAVQKGFFTI